MKKIIALLFALIFVFSLAACKKVTVADVPAEAEDLRVVAQIDGKDYQVVSYDAVHNYYEQYQELVKKYGEPKFEDGKLKGVAVVRFGDFVGTGRQQMYVAYADGTKDYVNKQAVYIFDNGPGELIDKEGTSIKSDITSKDGSTPSVWIFKSSSKAYIVTGDDLSKNPVFHEYVRTSAGKEVYAFQKTSAKSDGTLIKINLTGLSSDDANKILDVTKDNIKTMKELYSKETYTIPN